MEKMKITPQEFKRICLLYGGVQTASKKIGRKNHRNFFRAIKGEINISPKWIEELSDIAVVEAEKHLQLYNELMCFKKEVEND